MSEIKKYNSILLQQYNIYKEKYNIQFTSNPRASCNLEEKIIYYNIKQWFDPDIRSIFDFLHEVGHLETNSTKMKRCVQEYLATQWAICQFNELKLELDDKNKTEFQEYIYKWREFAVKRNGKDIPSKNELKLNWSKGVKTIC